MDQTLPRPISRTWVTIALMVGIFVAALDQTIVDTAFPRMIADLHGETIFTWVITAYMLASTAIVPVVGKLADIYGRKIFYATGIVLFVAGSMLCGIAQDMTQLILYRGFQGIGAGMLMPIGFTIVGDLYPGAQRAKMQGVFSGVWGLSSILGPKLGGWITTEFGWRYVFFINLPIGLIALAMIMLTYRESRGEKRPIDWIGSFTVTAGIVTLLLALNKGGDWGWSSVTTLGLFAVAAVMLIVFLITERRVPEPVLDLTLFRNRTFSVMSLLGFIFGIGMFGAIVYIPWFIQGVVGVDPNQAGNVMTPMLMSMVVFSALAGFLTLKMNYRTQLTLGTLLMALAFFLMTSWHRGTTQWTATWNIMIMGAGLGLTMPVLTLAPQNAFAANKRGTVTSAATFFRQIGASVGITVLGVVYNHQLKAFFPSTVGPVFERLKPMLAAAPPAAAEAMAAVAAAPAILVRFLVDSGKLPFALPPEMATALLSGAKDMMSSSLHVVFWCSLGTVLVGTVVAQFMGSISLKGQSVAHGETAKAEINLMTE
ncbi:MAG TPA: MDR family MFS transporter [Symbiobacteriaceae bacterium]|nr:MDR family MFS transporter [Symbiobacteriaceae bacterium]